MLLLETKALTWLKVTSVTFFVVGSMMYCGSQSSPMANCTTERNDSYQAATVLFRYNSFNLSCTVSITAVFPFRRPAIECPQVGIGINVLIGLSQSDLRIPRESSNLIEVQLEYLDGPGSPVYEDGLLHAQRQHISTIDQWECTVDMSPTARVSTSCTATGGVDRVRHTCSLALCMHVSQSAQNARSAREIR